MLTLSVRLIDVPLLTFAATLFKACFWSLSSFVTSHETSFKKKKKHVGSNREIHPVIILAPSHPDAYLLPNMTPDFMNKTGLEKKVQKFIGSSEISETYTIVKAACFSFEIPTTDCVLFHTKAVLSVGANVFSYLQVQSHL